MTEFTKAHGNGNDFIIIDEWDGEVVPEEDKSEFAETYCDRRFGVGGDGVLFLQPSEDADNDMRMVLVQPDGGEAEMCGNGARCLVRYAVEEGYAHEGETVRVETLAGVREAVCHGEEVRIEMGVPSFDAEDVPAQRALVEEEVGGLTVTAVNTGVPHAVTFVEGLDDVNVEEAAPPVRHADVFPEGVNVNFVEKADDALRVRTFERGVEGETLACGTGAVAVASVARRLGFAGDEVRVETSGGPLTVTFENETAYMRGPAVLVYEGEIL
ncbi:MAG: diaminopimelate epimerase [Halobacteriales archaeon]|nr:diaminopimelate epimerase [Halobacteriales archaeon]